MDTNDINKRLQRAEDRALAAEMQLTRIVAIYETWRTFYGTDSAFGPVHRAPDTLFDICQAAQSIDLTAAREVMRKAAAYDTELPEMDKSLSLCRKRCESMKTLEGLSLDELNMRLTHRAEQVDALRAERDELAALAAAQDEAIKEALDKPVYDYEMVRREVLEEAAKHIQASDQYGMPSDKYCSEDWAAELRRMAEEEE